MNAEARDAMTLEAAWPLFGLRIRSEHLLLRLPRDGDMPAFIDLAKAGIHPPDQMPFGVAWSIVPSPAFERGFLQHHWGLRAGLEGLEACRECSACEDAARTRRLSRLRRRPMNRR